MANTGRGPQLDQPDQEPKQGSESFVPTLVLEVQVTKRKAFHYVLGPGDEPLYVSVDAQEIFDWLISQEYRHIIYDSGSAKFLVQISPYN